VVDSFTTATPSQELPGDSLAYVVHDPLRLPNGFAVVIGLGDRWMAEQLIRLAYQNRPLPAPLSGKQAMLLVFERLDWHV
jgi:hypothetical protein